jgi:hypothetical protein
VWLRGQLAYALAAELDDIPTDDEEDAGDLISLDTEDPTGNEETLTLQERMQVEISDAFMVLEQLAEEAGEEVLVEAVADLHFLWNAAALPEPGLAQRASDVRKMLGDFLQAEDPTSAGPKPASTTRPS